MEEREKRGERWKRASERRRETGGQEEKLGPRLVKRRHRKGETKQTTTGTTQEQLFVSFSFTLVFPRFFFKISFKNNKKNNKNKLTLKSQQLLARWRQDQSIHLATMWSIWNDKFHPSKTNEAFHFLFVLQSQPTQWLLLFVPVDFRRLTRWRLHVSNNKKKERRRRRKKKSWVKKKNKKSRTSLSAFYLSFKKKMCTYTNDFSLGT